MAIKLIIRRQGAGAGAPPEERTFDDPIITIGSDPAASLELSDPAVAPEQAIIISEDGRPLFINRAAGTRLNGEALAREARRTLSDGDTIHIGPYVISFETGNGFRPGASADELGEETLPAFGEETLPSMPARAADGSSASADARRDAGAAKPPAPQPDRAKSSGTSFAAILDSLRTEEDAFYFQVETATRGRLRVPVEGAELFLGWDETGQNVACGDARAVPAARAVVRKDWSGVVLQSLRPGTVSVNGEPVEAARRLHNGDRVTLVPPSAAAGVEPGRNFFIFYEPASLVVLDTLLPSQQFPPPVAAPPAEGAGAPWAAGALVPAPASGPPAQQQQAERRPPLTGRKYFGYFTLGEVALMACATLVAAAIIFLILEYS